MNDVVKTPCRRPNCPNLTDVLKGRYGGLCKTHREEVAAQIRAENRASTEDRLKPKKTPATTNGNGQNGARAAAVLAALKVARELDAAEDAARKAMELVKEKRAAYDEAVKGLHRQTAAL